MSGAGTPPDSELSANAVCAGCDNEITGANDEGLINFADSLFHTGCFKCSKCSSQIDFENSVVLIGEDGKAVCVNCSFKCKLCGEPILEEAITTDEDTYHSACFRCSKCQRAIGDYSFFHDDDKLWCTDCHANSVRQGSFDSLKERPLRDSVPRRSRIHSNNELKKDMSKASSLASMPGVSPEEYIAQLERELEERSRQLSNVEATLIKFKSTSKKALEEFRQVNDAHQKECLRRQQAEAKIETLQGQMHSVARADTKRQRSEEDAERLHKEIEFLHMQRSAAQKDIQEISAKKDALVAGIGQLLEARNAQGAPSSPTGQTESSRAQELARELDQIKGRFREEVASLQTQRDTLREEVHALLINRDGLFSEITALQEENRQLEANRARISEALIGSAEHLDALNELGASSASGARYPEMEELERTVSADTMEMKPMPLPPPRAGRPSGPRRDSKGTELSASPLPLKKSDSQEQSLTGPGLKRDKWTKDWKTNVKAAKTKLKNAIPQKTGDGDAASPSSISGMFKIGAKKATSKSDLDLTRIGPPPPKNDIRPTHSFQPHSYRSPRKCDLCADKLWGKEARCEGCGYHCHQKCVPAVVGQCFASSASAGPDSAPATASEHATFGVPLIQLLEQEGGATVPRIVVKCVAAVETRGMTVEGIYRKSGPMTQINRIVAAVDKGEDPDLDDATDITAVTSVLKQFFRDLPEPLLTTAQFKQWTDALRTGPDDQSAKLATISHLLSQLPPAHLTTLAYLILHLDRIQQHSSENLMTPANIGVVFGPGLLRPAHVETQMDLAESSAKNAVVEFLVRNAKALFAVGGSGAGVTQDEDVGAGDAGGRSQAEPDSAADDRPLPPTPGPLDVLKIRMQNQSHKPGITPKYRGTLQGVQTIWREERLRGLFKGLGTTTIAYIADRALWFAAYNQIKESLAHTAGRSPDDAGAMIHLNSSVMASMLTMVFVNPLWVIRTRIMVQSAVPGEATRWHYNSTWHAFSTILREEGFSALYKGFTPSLLGITHVAVQFPLYEQLKIVMRQLEHKQGRYAEDLSAVSILLASAGSKMVASVATYPHEVLRTRMQTQSARRVLTHIPDKICEGPNCPPQPEPTKVEPKYRGLAHATKVIFAEEGWRAFYRGLATNLVRTVPSSAFSLWIYEVLVQKMGHESS